MAMAATAIICLLAMPTLKINLGYTLTADQMAESFPSGGSEGSGGENQLDVKEYLGDDGISLDLGLEIKSKLLFSVLSGDPTEAIEKNFVDPNVKNIVAALKAPINKIGKGMVTFMFKQYYINIFENEIDAVKGSSETRTNEEIRIAGGLTDKYLKSLAEKTYDEVDSSKATVTSVHNVIVSSTKEANAKFNKANTGVTIPEFDNQDDADALNATKEMLDSVGMIKDDGESLYPMSVIMDAMLVDAFRETTNSNKEGKSSAPASETLEEKASKLNSVLADFIKELIPEDSYKTVAMVLKIVLAVLVVFIATWAIFFLNTLLRTLLAKKKVWTFTGPIFWILGIIQIILGVGLTIAVAAVMSNASKLTSMMGGSEETAEAATNAMANIKISIFTSMFVPSIILLILIPTMIAYGILKGKYKRELKRAKLAAPEETVVIDEPHDQPAPAFEAPVEEHEEAPVDEPNDQPAEEAKEESVE